MRPKAIGGAQFALAAIFIVKYGPIVLLEQPRLGTNEPNGGAKMILLHSITHEWPPMRHERPGCEKTFNSPDFARYDSRRRGFLAPSLSSFHAS